MSLRSPILRWRGGEVNLARSCSVEQYGLPQDSDDGERHSGRDGEFAPERGEEAPPSSSLPRPGWYPDPWGMSRWRWWDGWRWTGYVGGQGWGAPTAPTLPRPRGAGQGGEGEPALRAGWIAALGVVVGLLLDVVVGVVWVMLGGDITDTSSPVLILFSEIGLWIGLAGSCVVASRSKGTGSLAKDFGFRTAGWVDLPIGLATGVVGLVLSVVLGGILHSFDSRLVGSNSAELTAHHEIFALVVSAVVVCVGAPLFEELFFRGLVQGTLVSRIGTWAIPGQAVLFALAHYQPGEGVGNIGIFVVIFSLGCVLGYVRHRTRRLVPGMVAHSTFNLISFIASIASG